MKKLLSNCLRKITTILFYSVILSLSLPISAFSNDTAKNSVELSISVDPAFKNSLNPEHTLFVYARAAKGPRMPLAIVKLKAGNLPLVTKLDASMAMMPQMSLEKYSQVVFLARISASGNAITQSGDLIGQTGIIEWQTLDKSVSIVINKKY